MYQLPSIYSGYYKDYISRNVREFKLECNIKSGLYDTNVPESKISSILITNDLLAGAGEYTIGNLASGKLTMVVSSDVQVFETNTITLTLKLRAQDIHGTEIWIPVPLGRFHVFSVSSTKLSKTVEAYDDLYKKELARPFQSKLEYPTTAHKVIEEICSILEIGFDSASTPNLEIERPYMVIDGDKTETDSNQVCYGLKVGKALSCIATYLGGNFIVDGDLKLKFITYPKETTISYDFTKFAMPTINSASYNIKRITCVGYTDQAIEAKIDDMTGTDLSLESPFVDKARLLQILNDLSNISYQQAKVKIKGDPTLQLGDLIELYEIDNSYNIINKMTLPILRMNFSYTGGCSNDIESPCMAGTEKTIDYKGTITTRLDDLENNLSNTTSEIEKVNRSLTALYSIKDNIDTMDIFIDGLSTQLTANKVSQYNLILNQIEQSSDDFEKQYLVVFNNKYLE
jgi:hypothetical protein